MAISRDYRAALLHPVKDGILLKGLVSPLIREPAVDVEVGPSCLPFQAIEIYSQQEAGLPLRAVDLVANTYCRLSYPLDQARTGTFGTSCIGTPSFRTADGQLHLIPTISRAILTMSTVPTIQLSGRYGTMAAVKIDRCYRLTTSGTILEIKIKFIALQDIDLATDLRGQDAFRIISLSSMFANARCFDGNEVGWKSESGEESFMLSDHTQRGSYLPIQSNNVRAFAVCKRRGSFARRGTPGAKDTPTIVAALVDHSIPGSLGVRGFLDASRSVHDDSLNAWLEWVDAPGQISANSAYEIVLRVSAHKPDGEAF